MNRWYNECVDFLNTTDKYKDAIVKAGLTEKMMTTALKELKDLYEAEGFTPDPDFVVRCDRLIQIMNSHTDHPSYACWQMWTPYFTFMGMSSWNEMWNSI